MVAFVKTPVGNKRFVIEWVLNIDNNEVEGDAFQLMDCNLMSMTVRSTVDTGSAILSKLYASNYSSAPDWYSQFITLRTDTGLDTFLSPLPTISVPIPPATRWIFPRSEGSSSVGVVKISMLFQEI
jgi:hypothetical protein